MAKSNTDELNFIFKCFDGFLEGFVQQGKWFLQNGKTNISSLPDLLDGILAKCPTTLKNKVKSNGPGPFEQWENQIGNNSNQETQRCFKYVVWLWNLPDSQTKSSTKNNCVDGITQEYIFPSEKNWGIGGAKPRSQKPQEVKYLVLLLRKLSELTFNTIDEIKNIIVEYIYKDSITDTAIVDEVPFKNALLYLCKPDEFEPIFSNGHKESIVKTFPELFTDNDIDKALMQIREALMLDENEGFYRKDIRAIWGSDSNDTNEMLKRKNNLLNVIKMKQYKSLLEKSHNLILSGAPGTGKTYLAKEIAKAITGDNDEKNHPHYEMVQFHPSYDYSDFVEGLRPVKDTNSNIGFERKDGVFKAFCKKALNEGYNKINDGKWEYKGKEAPRFVFIIDEINRGEMSKIFGELFFSIDPGYRGIKGRIKTQYQNLVDYEIDANGQKTRQEDVFKDGFFVPKNVYIIGTMNDIDRSVESMDFAMRRRFAFKEIKATDRTDMWNDQNQLSSENIKLANSLMRSLNYAIEQIPGLTSAYHVGPSYFLKLKECNEEELWTNSLKGLLFEYLRGMPDADSWQSKLEKVYSEAKNNPFEGELQPKIADKIKNIMKS